MEVLAHIRGFAHSWRRYIKIGAWVALLLLGAIGAAGPNLGRYISSAQQLWIAVALATLAAICEALSLFAESESARRAQAEIHLAQDRARKRAIERFLQLLHRRLWPEGDGRNPLYRVSLFVPDENGDRLYCYYRTGGSVSDKKWMTKQPPGGRMADGVVGHIWLHGFGPNVPPLREGATPDEMKSYLEKGCITEDMLKKMSWPGAALTGALVQLSLTDGPIGVLLVERKNSPITEPIWSKEDSQVCGILWEVFR